ncbi:MAG: hypothetical protein Q8K75_01455 [Chlamydiales bacterium]|nr:hypothetical protein [Chlamydiales bacterium]
MKGPTKISLCFAAGSVGGIISGLILYLCGALGLMQEYGVKMAPTLCAPWIYQRVVWGGIFGLLFALPWLERVSWFLRGAAFSIVPILAQFFIFFPLVTSEGLFGFKLGDNTPYFVILFNLLWGLITAFWLRLCR